MAAAPAVGARREGAIGSWGPGLYSSDLALDLKARVRALARLPFDGARILELLSDPNALEVGEDEQTTFWLVIADQLSALGIPCDTAREKALAIIESEADLKRLEQLGADRGTLTQRRAQLAKLKDRFSQPLIARPRRCLTKPQPLLMRLGDVFVFPTQKGGCANPYLADPAKAPGGWNPEGWGVMVVLAAEHAFGYLAWYTPLLCRNQTWTARPSFEEIQATPDWFVLWPGTCSALHIKRMGLERVGSLALDPALLHQAVPRMWRGEAAAAEDLSICGSLDGQPDRPYVDAGYVNKLPPFIPSLSAIVRRD